MQVLVYITSSLHADLSLLGGGGVGGHCLIRNNANAKARAITEA